MTLQAPLAIEATALAKSFGDTTAVAGIDLAVPAGVVYGDLGPNGAGKTTTIRMLATLIAPGSGSARILGYDVVAIAVSLAGCCGAHPGVPAADHPAGPQPLGSSRRLRPGRRRPAPDGLPPAG